MAKEKKIQKNSFESGVNVDTDLNKLLPSFARFLLNCRLFQKGSKGKIIKPYGNTLINNPTLPTGNNIALGYITNEEQNRFFWFNWNSNGYHGVYQYNDVTKTITPVILNITDTNNIDIFHFDSTFPIKHVDLIADNLIYWVDGLNKARKFNIAKAVDKSATGYGTIITEDFITAYKQTAIYAPTVQYWTDITRPSNYLYAQQFKFAQRFIYDDQEISNVSDFSMVALAPNQAFDGSDNISYNNNAIQVQVATGNRLVTKIEVLVQMTNGETILPWQLAITLNKSQLQISDNTNYVYTFYNDTPLTSVDNVKVVRPYSFMPRVPYVQSFVKLAMTYGNALEGFPTVAIAASVAVTSQNLYLPSGTTQQLNSPAFTVSLTSKTIKHGGFLAHDSYWVTQTHFIIGHDVKAGNVFTLTGKNGATSQQQRLNPTYDNYIWTYTATVSDTAQTVAARFKAFLRSTGRGQTPALQADPNNGIYSESTDGSGNVSWDYWYLGHDNTQPTLFAGNVTPVNFITLTNNGYSQNVIKSGGSRKYAIVYCDDDGRQSLAYTVDSLLAKTPFLTQWNSNSLQQPLHTITITSQPPTWARYWKLVRTQDITDFIQMLIQSVSEVDVTGEGQYLDLVVGSLNAYQLIHPNSIIQYQFQRGDRIRFIRNGSTQTLYSYFETEVLSYKPVTQQIIDANIVCDGTANVTPADGVKTYNVGKYIVINGVQRTIEAISGSQYVLDNPINPTQTYTTSAVTTATYPNYTIIDIRGIIRINKPSGITFTSNSTVEVYHPPVTVQNEANLEQGQNFWDFGLKFDISNFGTSQAGHRGNVQDQDGNNPVTTPCVVLVTQGDCYIRQRFLPTNSPQNPQDVQGIVDSVEDPNYSDFYVSNLYSLGRVFPQDDGRGTQLFDQRERFSNNYIQGTAINGLNDFDALDYIDYNDNYGAILLTRFKQGMLKMFKRFKNTWTPVSQNIIVDNQGNQTFATSDKLLNTLQYSKWEGGIGLGGCYFDFGDYEYITSDNSNVILRGAQNGWEPISKKFFYDTVVQQFLTTASKNNLQLVGQYDKVNDEAIFSYPAFIQYLYSSGFNPTQWNMLLPAYNVSSWVIIQQPANSVANIVSGIVNITGTNTLGDDYLLYQGNLVGGGTTPVLKFCFTVTNAPNRPTAWQIDNTTAFCVQASGANNGLQQFKVLNQYYTDNQALTGFKQPNIKYIAPEAIVPSTATITYNPNTNVTPSGGVNGDVWYNAPADQLYNNQSGTWVLLTDRILNPNYQVPITNTTTCPIPPPPGGFMTAYAQYGMTIYSIDNSTGSGVPAGFHNINLTPPNTASFAFTTVSGIIQVTLTGMPSPAGHVYLEITQNGTPVGGGAQFVTGAGNYYFSLASPITSTDNIGVNLITM